MPDTLTAGAARASDATLVIQATPALLDALRAVTDSFAAREAIRVVVVPEADITGADMRLRLLPDADLVVITGAMVPQLPTESAVWTLPFAESPFLVPESALRIDSVARGDSARAERGRILVLTIPTAAPNSSVAERFVRYMLTEGRATLLRSGLHVLPRLALRGDGAPSGIRAIVDTVIAGDTVDHSAPRPR